MKQIAIIGPTASGKTSLAIDIAHKTDSVILSLDSLSVYKHIDIASAKPTLKERDGIIHFGIDEVYPNETFDVLEFIACYEKTKNYAQKHNKNIIIVGGTGFYLKTLIEGLSLGISTQEPLDVGVEEAYALLNAIDPVYMQKIEQNDKYRIEKAYNIYKQSKLSPSEYFLQNPKKPIIENLPIFEIIWDTQALRDRISLRTKQMIQDGVIDEVIFLEKTYTRKPNCMSSIGIVETLEFLDGKITKEQLEEKIATNTAQLAKRQRTFNKGQFGNRQIKNILSGLNSDILKLF
ncbi:MAG: tRNA (adenosine(37)-N6)-dimethylallyltransferase MiaA [Candidatus Marinarcus sp.]|uniref:tRNA (adenosine(37)-N6)-dimethylallyltransferase MiaA n=1 Tax=Candidatus Marinarcus sp. TaxID=3100987 RepID=UPI003B001B85